VFIEPLKTYIILCIVLFENQKHLTKKLKQLRIEQRKLQRCEKGSKNREKQRIKLAKFNEKLSNYVFKSAHD
jgi:transposase